MDKDTKVSMRLNNYNKYKFILLVVMGIEPMSWTAKTLLITGLMFSQKLMFSQRLMFSQSK